VRALIGLRHAAETLQMAAQGYLDDRANPDRSCHMDLNGLPKRGSDFYAVEDFRAKVSSLVRTIPELEALAADATALATRLNQIVDLYNLQIVPRWW